MTSVLNYPHLGIFILAWFVADLLTPILIRVAHRLNLLDRPTTEHKAQKSPVPFFGGVAIAVSFSIAIFSVLRFEDVEGFRPLVGILAGGLICVTLGFIDDHRPVNAVTKLLTLFATTLLLQHFGISLQWLPHGAWGLPNLVITLLWIVGATSALNSVDNTDGAAAGLAAIAAGFTFVIAWGSSPVDAQPWLSYLAIGLMGSCFGFLRYNFHPARIYLGDNGSLFIGFMLASMLVFAQYSSDPLRSFLIPPLILAVPLFDIVATTVLRLHDGTVRSVKDAIIYCGRDHTAHMLMDLGLTKVRAVLVMYALAVGGGITALAVQWAPTTSVALLLAGFYGLVLVGVGVTLAHSRTRKSRKQLEGLRPNREAIPDESSVIDWAEIDRVRNEAVDSTSESTESAEDPTLEETT